jgi:hypothetical protein
LDFTYTINKTSDNAWLRVKSRHYLTRKRVRYSANFSRIYQSFYWSPNATKPGACCRYVVRQETSRYGGRNARCEHMKFKSMMKFKNKFGWKTFNMKNRDTWFPSPVGYKKNKIIFPIKKKTIPIISNQFWSLHWQILYVWF